MVDRVRQLIWKIKPLNGEEKSPPTTRAICDLRVGNVKPIAQRVRKIDPKRKEKVADPIRKLFSASIVQLPISPWAILIMIIVEKRGRHLFMHWLSAGEWSDPARDLAHVPDKHFIRRAGLIIVVLLSEHGEWFLDGWHDWNVKSNLGVCHPNGIVYMVADVLRDRERDSNISAIVV